MTSKRTTKNRKLANSAEGGAASSGQVTAKVRFFFNGLKIDGGKLHKAHLSLIERWTKASGDVVDTHVVLYAPGCSHFSPEVRALFPVENNTELTSDYFETDRIRIPLGHPLFNPALAAVIQAVERDIRRCTKRGKLEDAANYQRKWDDVLRCEAAQSLNDSLSAHRTHRDDLQGVASGAARPWETERGTTTGEVSCLPQRTKLSPHDGMYVCPVTTCGCADIEGTEWVHLNSGQIVTQGVRWREEDCKTFDSAGASSSIVGSDRRWGPEDPASPVRRAGSAGDAEASRDPTSANMRRRDAGRSPAQDADYWCPACEEHHDARRNDSEAGFPTPSFSSSGAMRPDRVAILDADGTCAGDTYEPFTLDPKRHEKTPADREQLLLGAVRYCLAVLDNQVESAEATQLIRERLQQALTNGAGS